MTDLTFNSISIVLDFWDQAKYTAKDFDQSFGIITLEKLIEIQPRVKFIYGFDKCEKKGRELMLRHSQTFPVLIDSVLQILGPDKEFMEETFRTIAIRHKAVGVTISSFLYMGEALVFAIEHFLGKPLTDAQQEAWDEVYNTISDGIVKNMLVD